jgi:hypothetical protein
VIHSITRTASHSISPPQVPLIQLTSRLAKRLPAVFLHRFHPFRPLLGG